MKRARILFSLLIFTMCFSFISTCFGTSLEERTAELKDGITSEAVLIMENSTGKIVYENNGYQKKYPASTTKIMTAILTIEHCNLSETATASEYAIRSIPSGYSTANIQIGETLSIKDLLYALMLQSANEAAVILAEHVSGSMEAFCDLMNEKANEIGCQNTHFVNPSGIHNKEHYTTAYDLAILTNYALSNDTFKNIVGTKQTTIMVGKYPRNINNTNEFSVGLSKEFDDLGYIFILMFFASLMFSILTFTNLGQVVGAWLISFMSNLEFTGLPLVLIMFFVIVLMSFFIPDTVTKWTIASPILVPLFMKSNITPDFTQFIFKAADSAGKGFTPFFVYFIVMLALLEKYNGKESVKITIFGTLRKLLPTILLCTVVWIVILIGWFIIGLPLGPDTYPTM